LGRSRPVIGCRTNDDDDDFRDTNMQMDITPHYVLIYMECAKNAQAISTEDTAS
jgi:hypothetical protein